MKISSTFKLLTKPLSVVAVGVMVIPTASYAQLDEIVVTAQKRQENLQDVPIAVSAYSAQAMDALGINKISDLINLTPGLSETKQAGSNRNYYLRGVGTTDFHLTAASAVGQYFDGVTLTSGFQASSALFDMERVEVLKGPQNTLYGLNTTGGAINYISKKPEIGAGYNSTVKLTGGTDKQVGLDAAIGFDVSDKVAGRIAIHTNKYDGPFTSVSNGVGYGDEDLMAYRAAFLWELSDDTSLSFNIRGSENENNGAASKALGTIAPTLDGLCADFNQASIINYTSNTNCVTRNGAGGQPGVDPSTGSWDTVSQTFGMEDLSTQGVYIKLDHEMDFATLNVMISHDNLDVKTANDTDASSNSILHLMQEDDRETDQFEARLVSNSDTAFRWILGTYYLDQESESFTGAAGAPAMPAAGLPRGYIGGGGRLANVQLDHTKENVAVYGQGEYDLSDDLTLTLGARWSDEEITGDYLPSKPTITAPLTTPLFSDDVDALVRAQNPGTAAFDANGYEIVRQVNRKLTNEDVGYTVKLDYKLSDDSMVYASHSKGFKGGAADIRAAFALVPAANLSTEVAELSPETLIASEIGYKGSFLDNSVQLDLAAFMYTYEDLQQFSTVAGVPRLINADESEITGIDGNIRYASENGLYIDLGFSFLDTEVTDGGTDFLTGAELAGAPDFSASLVVSKDFDLNNGGELNVTGNVSHTGDKISATLPASRAIDKNNKTQEAFTLLNASITYRPVADSPMSLMIFGNNLTGEEYCGFRGYSGEQSTAVCRVTRGSTRTLGASIRYVF